jgi:hypothetical protein
MSGRGSEVNIGEEIETILIEPLELPIPGPVPPDKASVKAVPR